MGDTKNVVVAGTHSEASGKVVNMEGGKSGFRKKRAQVKLILFRDDYTECFEQDPGMASEKAVNALFHFFFSGDEVIKFRAITAMGIVMSRLAETRMEAARIVMRRLIWNLNDESGGIGWGSPEAMGEILARHRGLAEEYHRMLLSYIMEDGNYIEHFMLQRGVLWGLGRFARVHPDLAGDMAELLVPYMNSDDTVVRGTAVWAAGAANNREMVKDQMEGLREDGSIFKLFIDGVLMTCSVGELAEKACSGID